MTLPAPPSLQTSRRRFLGAVAGTAVGAGALATPAAAAETDLSGWFENTSNADEIVDKTGQDTVTVEVGVDANNGPNGFGPAAVRIDPGATVVWTWTGKGFHNVVAKDGGFESKLTGEKGHTFEQTISGSGVTKYYCAPHRGLGMKGALIAGDVSVSLSGSAPTTTTTGPATTDGSDGRSFGGWLAQTGNYDGVVDETGQDEVTVEVGATGNGGPYAFSPPAIHVSPGTTVVWKWVSDGVTHDVVDADGRYESTQSAQKGTRYAVSFDGSGLSKYECTAHSGKGMRGVVLVGQGPRRRFTTTGLAALGGFAAVVGAGLLKGLHTHAVETTAQADESE